jgi:hypothetical protein
MAEVNLLAARNAADQERRDAATKEAQRIHARICRLKPEAEEAKKNARIATNLYLDLRFKIRDAQDQINSWSAELDPLAFASDAVIANRKQQARLWQRRLAELTEQAREAKENEGILFWKAKDMAAELQVLLYQFNNYNRVASEGEPESGLSIGSADFLAVPGSLDHLGFPSVVVRAPGMRRLQADGNEPEDRRSVWEKLCG